MELLVLIPLGLLALLLYAVIAVTHLRGRVRHLDEELRRVRADLSALEVLAQRTVDPAKRAIPTGLAAPDRSAEPGAPVRPESVPATLVAVRRVAAVSSPAAELAPAAASPPVVGSSPVVTPAAPVPAQSSPSQAPWLAGVSLEQFMGVKLFAWIGGLALFLGAAFFVKHSFDQGWISPTLRVAAGFLTGLGLLIGGVWLRRTEYRVGSHTLCGAGVVILYMSSFAAHAYYQLIGQGTAFALMSLVTIAAFLLADRLVAAPVAVLGILGGFLTPPLLATSVDRPLGLFSYVGLLDLALLAIALRRRWPYLVALGVVGTVLTQLGWAGRFFAVEKVGTALAIFVVFNGLFLAGLAVARGLGQVDRWITGPALAMPFVTFAFAGWLLGFAELGRQPAWLFSFLLLAELCVMGLVLLESKAQMAHPMAGVAAFLWLAGWITSHLESGLLGWALGGCLGFAGLHTAFPWWLERRRPGTGLVWPAHLFPLLALVLVMLPLFRNLEVTWLVWPAVFAVDLLAIGLALISGALFTLLGAFGLTVLVMAAWLQHAPAELEVLPELLVVVVWFAVLFHGVGLALRRGWLGARPDGQGPGGGRRDLPAWFAALQPAAGPDAGRELLPATSAILPFLLLIMAVGRLPLVNPTPVFGVGLLLAVMLLAAGRWMRMDALAPVALGCVLALEFAWHQTRSGLDGAAVTVAWNVGFTALFVAYPFVCRGTFAGRVLPWAASALAGPLHFLLVYQLVKMAWPNGAMGLLPAAFAIPMLGAVAFVRQAFAGQEPMRLRLLAWYGGSALFFITLIFPIQFEREWLTLGWALEGAALVWLFGRVPHPGLRGVGVVLLAVAFVRLALNPAVLGYHPRGTVPVLNWYLYSYGVVTVCLVAAARWLASPRNTVFRINAPPVLYTLAAVLGFLLLNIEIADCFSTGATLTFDFRASLGQDMTYSLAWGLYALGLLALGFRFRSAGARHGGMGLLVVTLLKLFLFDLWRLGGLYRVGSLLGLAVVLIAVSFAYQRYFGSGAANRPEPEVSRASRGS